MGCFSILFRGFPWAWTLSVPCEGFVQIVLGASDNKSISVCVSLNHLSLIYKYITSDNMILHHLTCSARTVILPDNPARFTGAQNRETVRNSKQMVRETYMGNNG